MPLNYFAFDALGSTGAALAFAVILLPPGYLFGYATDVAEFRRRGPVEQLLWSICLSVPLALVISAVCGRYLAPPGVLLAFALLAISAVVLVGPRVWRARPFSLHIDRPTRLILLGILMLAAYVTVLSASIQIGSRLFESVNSSDWSVRIPLVGAALRNGVPPGNPMFAYQGHAQPSRYYFYWYSLCAQVARATGLSARAALSGSALWSGIGLLSVILLYLKHFAGVTRELRRQCVIALGLCCVMGIDILPALAGLVQHPIRLAPEIEWWRGDRIPSFLGALLFAPHHIGGVVCAAVGFLVLALASFQSDSAAGGQSPRRQLVAALAGGICFAATAGTSTYIAFCFAFICALYGLDLLRHRRWMAVGALLLSGVVAVLLSRPFLHELLSGPASTVAQSGHSHFFRLTVRDLFDARRVARYGTRLLHHEINSGLLSYALGALLMPLLFATEFGFFIVPLAVRIRRDAARLSAHLQFPAGERALWACFVGAAIPAIFISSDPTQGVNDLGRHSGLILRLVLIVWSTPIVYEALERRRRGEAMMPHRPLLTRFALALLVIGVATQLWQVALDRTFLIIVQKEHLKPERPFQADADLGGRYFDLRKGLDTAERSLPSDVVIAGNPGSRYLPIAELYAKRQFAAGDSGCVATFGGSPALCKVVVGQLEKLYGGPADSSVTLFEPLHTNVAPDAQETTTVATFQQVCLDQHIAVLLALNSDPAWGVPNSWVWQEQPLYATPRVRIFSCPAMKTPS